MDWLLLTELVTDDRRRSDFFESKTISGSSKFSSILGNEKREVL